MCSTCWHVLTYMLHVRVCCWLTSCTCTLLVYRVCMSVCLLPLGSADPPLIILRVCVVKCDCKCCYTVYVCLLYTLALCTLTICVDTVTCSVVLFRCLCWFVRVTRIVWYSSTRDLLGLAVTPGWCVWQPWMLLTRSRSLVARLSNGDSWLRCKPAMIIVGQRKCSWRVYLYYLCLY